MSALVARAFDLVLRPDHLALAWVGALDLDPAASRTGSASNRYILAGRASTAALHADCLIADHVGQFTASTSSFLHDFFPFSDLPVA